MGRAARRDAGPARPRRGDPHARPIPAALGRPLADRPLVHPGRVRGAQASRHGERVPPCRGGGVGAVELPRVGASGRGQRRALSRPPVATATAPASKDQSQAELHRRMLRQMLLIRRFEEKAAEAYALGKIGGFCHLYIGQEAVAVGSLAALREDDYVISSYREHGQALARGVPANALVAELFGKATGWRVTRRRGAPLSSRARAATRPCSKFGPTGSWATRCPTRCTACTAPRKK